MLYGHGDDTFLYPHIRVNFSSNVYSHFDHRPLFQHLASQLEHITSYPEPTPTTLETQIAAHLGVASGEVCATNGATEAIYLIAQTFRHARTAILQPTFSEYADACRLHGHALQSFYSLAEIPPQAETVWLCNPNNPTGAVLDDEILRRTLPSKRLFIIDQSYAPFTTGRCLTAIESVQYHNVITLHSMTKAFAIPGLRIGYMVGNAKLLQEIRPKRMPWSVNQMAIDAAQFLLAHQTDYTLDLHAMTTERTRVEALLHRLGAVEVWPSDTHILLCRLRTGKAAALKHYLATEHGLLIRDASNFEGLSEDFFRIAIQLPEENDLLIGAMAEWLAL